MKERERSVGCETDKLRKKETDGNKCWLGEKEPIPEVERDVKVRERCIGMWMGEKK